VLYAQDQWSLLLIFQAMDAAGKGGAIKHVMSGLNPQGCQVFSFKSPSAEDLEHDLLWRCLKCLPERGRIGIFNRSYYEETLVVRVHPELLVKQKVPPQLITKNIWEARYEDIRNVERYLTRNGVVIRKFFLHVSAVEQKKRFLECLDDLAKNWKFSPNDSRERGFWKDYMKAYKDMICNTATDDAPWFVIPADNKWFTRVVIAAASDRRTRLLISPISGGRQSTGRGKKGTDGQRRSLNPNAVGKRLPRNNGFHLPKVSGWKAIFPPAQWVPTYQAQWFKSDLLAGITLGAYALAEGVAYASLASLSPVADVIEQFQKNAT
jgi:PPK2 family polyphosphate:nucleotide phosphotransferase